MINMETTIGCNCLLYASSAGEAARRNKVRRCTTVRE